MTTNTIECVGCGEPVQAGRLSCPSCGELLAAVARATRTETAAAQGRLDAPAAPSYLIDPTAPMLVDTGTEAPKVPWAARDEPARALVARAYGRDTTSGPDEPGSQAPTPGAYLPPNLASPAAAATWPDRRPAWPVGGPTRVASEPAAPMPATTPAGGALPVIDAARIVEVAGWLVVVGSVMGVLGFLLPWSVAVIGASGTAGYLDHWGLASPSHLLVVAGLLGLLALGVVHTPVPTWLRTGVLGLGLGGLLFGLTWPYLLGPLGADIGVLMTGGGGVALLIGGAVASWATRHEGAHPPV